MNNKSKIKIYIIKIFVFAGVIFLISVIGMLLPLRPAFSESEKRELSKFPEFTFEALFSGDYFTDIGAWYSDTYPGREGLIALNTKLKNLYGFSSEAEIHGEVIAGDEIPSEFDTQPDETTTRAPLIVENLDTQSLGAVFVAGNVGYEYYNFSKSLADHYVSVINELSDKMPETTNFYSMLVPTSIAITLPDNYINTINSSNQEEAICYMLDGMEDDVKKVSVYDTLMTHREEYIYFNTDHHWTALGAYYAYEEFCKASGKPVISLTQFEKIEYDGFRGSFYNDTGKIPSLQNNPDTITAYAPNKNAEMHYTDKKGNRYKWPVIYDVSGYNETLKYSTFIGGDNPFTEIINPDITDNSSILVVKESYGNAFVPFLVENYNKVYVIDYRYYNGSVISFVTENGVQDVLYLNNISATRNKWLVSRIEATI